jgi:hypothetical protein
MKELGVEKSMSFGNQVHDMQEWRRKEISSGIYNFPEATVNGLRHYEDLTALSVFEMLCSSLLTPPDECTGKTTESHSNIGLIFVVIGCSILFLLVGVICYRRMIHREISNDMSSKVNELVAKYVKKVSEQNKKQKEKLM